MVITVTLNPAIDKTLQISNFTIGEVNRVEDIRLDVGGKGVNVSKSLKGLGLKSIAMGVLGGSSGAWIADELKKMGIEQNFVHTEQATRTNTKIVDLKLGTYTDVNEKGEPINQTTLKELEKQILQILSPNDVVVLAGKLSPETDVNIYGKWIELFQKKGARVFLDSDGKEFIHGVSAKPSLIKPNEEELSRLVQRPLATTKDLIDAGKTLIRQGIQQVVISLGSKGAVFIDKNQVLLGHGLAVKVQSTVEAGDAMMAALTYGYVQGLSFSETAKLAIATSSATIMEKGTRAATMDSIEALLNKVKVEVIE